MKSLKLLDYEAQVLLNIKMSEHDTYNVNLVVRKVGPIIVAGRGRFNPAKISSCLVILIDQTSSQKRVECN